MRVTIGSVLLSIPNIGKAIAGILKIVTGTAFAGDTYGAAYDETDSKLLGIKELTEEDLKTLVATKLA